MSSVARTPSRPHAIHALTGIRFFAAFAVLLFHYGATFLEHSGVPGPIAQFLHNGYLGVSLFFVLSGFILTYAHSNDKIDGRFIADFYVARLSRIYPVYLLALLVALPLRWDSLSALDAAKVLAMVQSWTLPQSSAGYTWVMQAWTLSVELFFYLLFPAIFYLVRKCGPKTLVALAAALSVLIVALGLSSVVPSSTSSQLFGDGAIPIPVLRTAEFLYGIVLCRIHFLMPGVRKYMANGLVGIGLTAAIIVCLMFARDVHTKAVVTVLVGLLILNLSGEHGPVSAFLSGRIVVLLGGASYAVYLLQGPIRAWCELLVKHPFDRIVSPVATIGIAILVFLYVEQPARKFILSTYRATTKKLSTRVAPAD